LGIPNLTATQAVLRLILFRSRVKLRLTEDRP